MMVSGLRGRFGMHGAGTFWSRPGNLAVRRTAIFTMAVLGSAAGVFLHRWMRGLDAITAAVVLVGFLSGLQGAGTA
jgi:hypothetical protein